MAGWKRIVLVWLMALALPAQGLAAVTMLLCGNQHPQRAAADVTATAPASAPQRLAQAAPCHASQDPTAEPAAPTRGIDGSVSAPAGLDPATAGTEPHRCSVCASCCSVGALSAPVLAVPTAAPASTTFTTVVARIEAVTLDGFERPPRTATA